MIDRDIIDSFIAEHNQFPKNWNDSWLWRAIRLGCTWAGDMGVTDSEAKELGKTHCNSIAIYSILRGYHWIEFAYAKWIEIMLVNKLPGQKELSYMKRNGYINASLLQIGKLLGFHDKLSGEVYIDDYDKAMSGNILKVDKLYKIKVIPTSTLTGTHFMAGYALRDKNGNPVLHLSDSSYRGIRVPAKDVIKKEKFVWIQEI